MITSTHRVMLNSGVLVLAVALFNPAETAADPPDASRASASWPVR